MYVERPRGRVEVGDVERVLDHLGGADWRVEYGDPAEDCPDLDTADEGLVVDVVDAMGAMTLDRSFVRTLAAQPHRHDGGGMSPRLEMFVGRLESDLQYGVE